MAKTYCRLDNGDVVRYSAAFPLDSTKEISDALYFLGVGVICRVAGRPYNGPQRLKFYITRYKYHGNKKQKRN